MSKVVLRIEGMHCVACAAAIDLDLEDVPGVAEARTSFARAETAVAYDPARVSLETLIATIARSGYAARPKP